MKTVVSKRSVFFPLSWRERAVWSVWTLKRATSTSTSTAYVPGEPCSHHACVYIPVLLPSLFFCVQLKKEVLRSYSVTLEEEEAVRNLRPAVVKVYDYYQTSMTPPQAHFLGLVWGGVRRSALHLIVLCVVSKVTRQWQTTPPLVRSVSTPSLTTPSWSLPRFLPNVYIALQLTVLLFIKV